MKGNSLLVDINLNYNDSLYSSVEGKFVLKHLHENVDIVCEEFDSSNTLQEIMAITKQVIKNIVIIQHSVHTVYMLSDNYHIRMFKNNKIVSLSVKGSQKNVDYFKGIINVAEEEPVVHWFHKEGSSFAQESFPLKNNNMPIDEMYPFIKDGLTDYYDRYMKSSASILLLIGPPGCGKTTFLRGLLHYTSSDSMMTYDELLLQDDHFFIRFIKSDDLFLIIEDADTMIRPRDEGNKLVARFLNLSDGIMDIQNKKIVFTTNLDSLANVDPALTREGRCFDVLHFRHLNFDEATKLADKCEIDFNPARRSDEFPVSEVFNNKRNNDRKTKLGFF